MELFTYPALSKFKGKVDLMKIQNSSSKAVKLVLFNLFLVFAITGSVYAEKVKITKQEVIQNQKEWANGLVAIGKAYTDGKDYKKTAKNLINKLYAYQLGKVLFKPTKAADIKFRMTKEGALSYFVGHNKKFPEDKGFALEPWTKVKFKNAGILLKGNIALAIGKYFFTNSKGVATGVEYSFGYEKDKNGQLKIILHHSSLPYSKE